MEQAADIKPWQRLTVRFGKIVLTLLLAWLMALLVWLIIAPEPLYLKAPTKGGSNRTSFESAGAGSYHVFGEVGVAEVVEVKAVDAPDTRLRLSLLGATQSSVEEESSAIIARKGSGGDFYRIGDVVEGRTRLAAVYKDKVILDTAGKLETLKFERYPVPVLVLLVRRQSAMNGQIPTIGLNPCANVLVEYAVHKIL